MSATTSDIPRVEEIRRTLRRADSRWYPLRKVEKQMAYARDVDAMMRRLPGAPNFIVGPAGRRSGKTEIAKRKGVRAAAHVLKQVRAEGARYGFGAPTHMQAKKIFWGDLVAMANQMSRATGVRLVESISISEMTIRFYNGNEIAVFGLDRPERVEGPGWDGFVVDECANVHESAFDAHIYPALADRNGWLLMIGVPEGRNHYFDKDQRAIKDDTGVWKHHTWFTEDVLGLDHPFVVQGKKDLDPVIYDQEFHAAFTNFSGRAYYQFTVDRNVARCRHLYNPAAPLILCFDFNVEPGVAAVGQEVPRLPTAGNLPGTAMFGEVWIPRNSNTHAVCNKLIEQWGDHPGPVRAYGDATGGARGTAQVEGSDWDIIRALMRARFGSRFDDRVENQNPRERARVNVLNARCLSASGEVRMAVDPEFCEHLINDLEGVCLLEGGSGEIDKDPKRFKMLTHISDALGYYLYYEFRPDMEESSTEIRL